MFSLRNVRMRLAEGDYALIYVYLINFRPNLLRLHEEGIITFEFYDCFYEPRH